MAHLTRVKRRLALHSRRRVPSSLTGQYASTQVGRGIDFNDLRSYVRGDDVKDIDWKASARGRQLLVRRYVAERQHRVLLCVSTGRSMAALNDVGVSKRELAVLVTGVVGYLAVSHGDQVALAHGDAARCHLTRTAAGEVHLERLLGTVHDAIAPTGAASDLAAVLEHVVRTVRRRTILVVVADETVLSPRVDELLRRLLVQHEVLFLTIADLDPTVRGPGGRLFDVDAGTEIPHWLRDDPTLGRQYAELVATEEAALRRRLDRLGIAHEQVADADSAIAATFRLLDRHRRARH